MGCRVSAIAHVICDVENGGCCRRALEAREIEQPAGLPKPALHVRLEARLIHNLPTRGVRAEEDVQPSRIGNAFDGNAGGRGCGVKLRLAYERGVKTRLVVAKPRQLAAERPIVVARHDLEPRLDTLGAIPASQGFDLLLVSCLKSNDAIEVGDRQVPRHQSDSATLQWPNGDSNGVAGQLFQ